MFIALSLCQANAFVLVFVAKLGIQYNILLIFFVGLLFSLSIKNLKKSIIFTYASILVGIAICLMVLIIPPTIYTTGEFVSFVMQQYMFVSAPLFFLSIPANLFAVLIGSFASDGI